MKLTVFGIGYVGLVQAAVFAHVGHDVLCIDVDAAKVARLKDGIVPIFEPGLEELVRDASASGNLRFSADPQEGVAFAPIQLIAVGTPPSEDGSADLKHVMAVAETIGRLMEEPKIVIGKSTVPVGTCDLVREGIRNALKNRGRGDLSVDVVSNPEFLKEGSAVADCLKPDRIIIGLDTEEPRATIRELYAPFNRNREKILWMDVRSAELTKYAANCMLATKISFMNEMANLAERLGADIESVRKGIGSDPRIGYDFIYPGIGYGGSCFPKDVRAMIATAGAAGFDPALLRAVELRNNAQKSVLAQKVIAYFNGDIAGRTFALWGLAFKPNTDDMRDAPSRHLMEALWAQGARIQAFDPEAAEACQQIYGSRADLSLCGTKEQALQGADALLIATEWKSFRAPDFGLIRRALIVPAIFDGRNMYEPQTVRRYGLDYISIGRSMPGDAIGQSGEAR